MTVSTNQVFLVRFDDGEELFAKVSTYGSYVHFKKDHQLIHEWENFLQNTRFERFLARVATKDGAAFSYRHGNAFVALYHKVRFYDFLPRVLTDGQVEAFGHEMACLHRESTRVAKRMGPSWKSVGSDIATLFDLLGQPWFREHRGLSEAEADVVRMHCDHCLEQAERFGYHRLAHVPVLIDWNITNFSVGLSGDGFRLFSRWDYDWFRVEPRCFDFYFCARVVRAEGDQSVFSYHPDPFLEPRFERFLKAYHATYPLTESDILLTKEAYRFFLLNYVIRVGEHFYRPEIWQRLHREVITQQLSGAESLRLEGLVQRVL